MREKSTPKEKLSVFEEIVTFILRSASNPVDVPSSTFCSLLCFLLAQAGLETVEVEAEIMWGLLHPSILAGDGGHFLSLLSSSLHVLKNVKNMLNESENEAKDKISGLSSPLLTRATLSVLVADERIGSFIERYVPVRKNMTAKEVSRSVGRQLKVSNAGDFALFKYPKTWKDKRHAEMGKLTLIEDHEEISMENSVYIFKRKDTSIV